MTSFFKNAQQRRPTVTSNALCFVTFNQSGATVSTNSVREGGGGKRNTQRERTRTPRKPTEPTLIPCFSACDKVRQAKILISLYNYVSFSFQHKFAGSERQRLWGRADATASCIFQAGGGLEVREALAVAAHCEVIGKDWRHTRRRIHPLGFPLRPSCRLYQSWPSEQLQRSS